MTCSEVMTIMSTQYPSILEEPTVLLRNSLASVSAVAPLGLATFLQIVAAFSVVDFT